MAEIETLRCESGHTWTRAKQRGRKPSVCGQWPGCRQQGHQNETANEEDSLSRKSEISPETNVFILKARQKSEASGATFPISEAPQGILSADGPFHHPELPGITISEIRRLQAPTKADDEDAIRYVSAPEWTAKVTINGEVYDCKRFGGWEIILDDNRRLALKPSIAFVIQEHIRPLEKVERSRLEKELEAAKIERAKKQAKQNRKEPTQHGAIATNSP